MNLLQTLAITCSPEMHTILGLVNTLLNVIRLIVPIVLIVLAIMDIAKVVMNSNLDDKVKKEATSKLTTRVIYAIIIFLIPTIVRLVFRLVTIDGVDMSLLDCMEGRVTQK